MTKLTEREIELLLKHYIGFDQHGFLTGFEEGDRLEAFLQVYCDLDIKPTSRIGAAVAREFVEILFEQTPTVQAKIVRTVLAGFPPDRYDGPHTRNALLHKKLSDVASRLESSTVLVEGVAPKSSSDVVQLALRDADYLISRGDARSAVAKTHTALHGHIKLMCDDESILYEDDVSLPKLFKLLRENHSSFQSTGLHQEKIDNVAKDLSTAMHSLNEIRNQASDAHPNDELLDVVDATLAINAMRTIIHYVEEKRSSRGGSLLDKLLRR